jgi:hypothetical protein
VSAAHFYRLSIIVVFTVGITAFARVGFSQPAAAPVCNEALWKHVYAGDPDRFQSPKDRLRIIEPCITVTGKIFSIKFEADGDRHVRVTVDKQYKSLLNKMNRSGQKGKLVIEPVCQRIPTQQDTIDEGVCKNYRQKIKIPKKGTRVRITGVLIEDMEHHWIELHPVTSVKVLKQS